jgi:methionine synthase I (cobalamin-dependent)
MAVTTKQRLDKHEERLDKHDRQVAAIRALIQEGMRLVIETRKDLRTLNAAQNRLAAMQQVTEAKLQVLIDSMKRGGGNGHSKKRVDLG